MGISKAATEIYFAALGNGNVSGGGPYDSSGNLRPGAVQLLVFPAAGDFKIDLTPPPVVYEMHNGQFTGSAVSGDNTAKSASAGSTPRDLEGRNFALGRHPTAISTISDSETTNSPADVPFHFWVKRLTKFPSGLTQCEIFGHAYAKPSQQQGPQETVNFSIEVIPVPWVVKTDGVTPIRDGIIYMIP